MFNSNAPSVADIAAVTGNNGCNGYGGWVYGNDLWAIIILLALFGGFGRGGFGFGNGGCGCDSACATVGDVERGFNQQNTNQRFNGLDQGLSQLGYADLQQFSNISNGLCQLGYQTQDAVNGVSRQLADCCCGIERSIDSVNFNMSQGFAQQSFQNQQCCCEIKEAINDSTRAITDQLTAFRMEDKNEQIAELRSQVQALNLAQSQANQNQYLLGRLQPNPVPSYQVASPYATYAGCGCYGSQSCCC